MNEVCHGHVKWQAVKTSLDTYHDLGTSVSGSITDKSNITIFKSAPQAEKNWSESVQHLLEIY